MFSASASELRTLRMTLALCAAALAATSARAGFDPFSIGGDATPASIQPTVDAFRAALGNPNNANNPGPLASGRREINWDGGGAVTASSSGSTLSAFTNTRGATMVTPGTGFLQTPLTDVALTGIQASYATTFSTFSPVRIFTPLGSNVTDVTFSIPGTNGATQATVGAFGAVFTDVDLANTTQLEFFDLGNVSLGTFKVASGLVGAAPIASLSFLGEKANAGERIARVRITTGNQALGAADSNGNPVDVVAMDDFIYAEPAAVPEPASLAMAAMIVVGVMIRRTLRRD